MTREQLTLVAEFLSYLEGRWSDESEYEDWSEYEESMRKHLRGVGASYVAMTRRPFRVVFVSDGFRYEAKVKRDKVTVQSVPVDAAAVGPSAVVTGVEGGGWRGHMAGGARGFTVTPDYGIPGTTLRVIRWDDGTQPTHAKVCMAILDAVDAWEAKHGG